VIAFGPTSAFPQKGATMTDVALRPTSAGLACCPRSIHHPNDTRGDEIPIEPAAPSRLHFPRFRALALSDASRRRAWMGHHAGVRENLHTRENLQTLGLMRCSKTASYSIAWPQDLPVFVEAEVFMGG